MFRAWRLPALLTGYRLAFTVGTGCVAVAFLFALVWFAAPRLRRTVELPAPAESVSVGR